MTIILHFILEWFTTMKKATRDCDKQTLLLRWIKPPLGHFKLNVDGSRDGAGIIGAGGVVRDCSGNWIQGFSHHIGFGEVIQAEIWGIYIGLKMAADLQLKHLLVESDSAIAINLLNSTDIDLHPLATIINNCHAIMHLFDACRIQHVHRECNFVADALAKDNSGFAHGTTFFGSPPSHIARLVFDDLSGNVRPRVVGLNRPVS